MQTYDQTSCSPKDPDLLRQQMLDSWRESIRNCERQIQECPEQADLFRERIRCLNEDIAELMTSSPENPTQPPNKLPTQPTRPMAPQPKPQSQPSPSVHQPKTATPVDSQPIEPGHQAAKCRQNADETPENNRPCPARLPLGSDLRLLDEAIRQELKQNSQSPLDKLSQEQQTTLFELLQIHSTASVLRNITAPPPEGWGVETSHNSLRRFKERYEEAKRRERRIQLKQVAKSIIDDVGGADGQFVSASETLFKLRLLETANNPASNTRELRDLFQILSRLRATSSKIP